MMSKTITIVRLGEEAVSVAKFRYVMRVTGDNEFEQIRVIVGKTLFDIRDALYERHAIDWDDVERSLAETMAWSTTYVND